MAVLDDLFANAGFLTLGTLAGAVSNPNPNTLTSNPAAETIVTGCDLTTVLAASIPLTWDLQASMNAPGQSKQVTWRVRRDNLAGAILSSIVKSATIDSSAGNDSGFAWASSFTDSSPTTAHYVLTSQATSFASTIFIAKSVFTATGGPPSTAGFTTEVGEPLTMPVAATGWAKFQPAISGIYQIDTIGSAFDTGLAVYSGSALGSLTLLASDNNSGASSTSVVSLHLTAGTTYMVQVGSGSGTAAGTLSLTVTAISYDATMADPVALAQAYGTNTAGLLKGRTNAANDAQPGG